MILLIAIAGAAALLYQAAALIAVVRHHRRREPSATRYPPISILKPIRGLDPGFREAIRSHAAQDYPEFEILFGVARPDDPALAEIEDLRREFPHRAIRAVPSATEAPNGKVGVLIDLAREARHDVLLVNDSDIGVPPDYLRRVVAPLEDPRIGVVTCLYRAAASTRPGIWEALGIATDFAPGVVMAPWVGVKNSGLGATLVFHAADLERAGGFEAIADSLADDNELAARIARLGFRTHLSRLVVETSLQAERWRDVWNHQLRWHRTVRVTHLPGYCGLPVTFAAGWAAAAAGAGLWELAAALLGARMAMALAAGRLLGCPITRRWFALVPLRDLWGVAVWFAGLFGDSVEWRGFRMKLSRGGRILSRTDRGRGAAVIH